jgi:hypothetical protein
MKKLIFLALVCFSFSETVFAFTPRLEFFVNREVAIARVWNTNFRPIVCSGMAFGRTYQGVVLNAYANNLVIYPNASVDIYVHSNYYDPMAVAWAQIDCQFTW